MVTVLVLHAGAVVATLAWASQHELPSAPPPAAVMIDLAPLPAAPSAEPAIAETTPEVPPPPEPPRPKIPPKPKMPPKPKRAELALPQPAPHPPTPPPPSATAQPLPAAPVAAAPAAGPVSSQPPSNALPTWQGALLAHLEKHKRYPRTAQLRRQQGTVTVVFTLDRQGRVLAQRLHKSSGHDSLDAETLALLNRAQPLPPPPVEIAGDRIELMVPVQFYLR